MTLVMALNLTDRIIIAGDTMVTNSKTKKILGYCIKVIQFGDKERKNFISCAFAGRKHFVMFLATKISEAIESGELSTDINWLTSNIDDFFKKVVPLYEGGENNKSAFIIFAGVSLDPKTFKAFDVDAFHEIFGPGGGRIDDENLMFALQTNFIALPTREQKIFSYKISTEKGIFEMGEVGGVYSFLYGGSTVIEEKIQKEVKRIFLDKRPIEEEAKDVVNLLRSKYSDTIGGAVNIGYIDSRGKLVYIAYEISKSAPASPVNWSTRYGEKIIGIGPDDEEVDLIAGFYDDMAEDQSLDLEI